MLSTRDPGGDSCRAMVSDVSMVKYRSMGHAISSERNALLSGRNALFSGRNTHQAASFRVVGKRRVYCCCWRRDTHCCTRLSGHESGLQTEGRARRPPTPTSSSSPVGHKQETPELMLSSFSFTISAPVARIDILKTKGQMLFSINMRTMCLNHQNNSILLQRYYYRL